jgi:hypothetical protein
MMIQFELATRRRRAVIQRTVQRKGEHGRACRGDPQVKHRCTQYDGNGLRWTPANRIAVQMLPHRFCGTGLHGEPVTCFQPEGPGRQTARQCGNGNSDYPAVTASRTARSGLQHEVSTFPYCDYNNREVILSHIKCEKPI